MQLTVQQSKALRKMEAFIDSSELFFGLFGYAGTGKSTVIFNLIEKLKYLGKKVVLTTPTNKALGVLRKMSKQKKINVDLCTIHQLLGLAPVKVGTEKILKQVSQNNLHYYDVVVLDEGSMVPGELWEIVKKEINKNNSLFDGGTKLIVMGDPAQLPPVSSNGVNEKRSPSFNIKNKAVLTEVVRQGADSPLLEFVTACRQAVKTREVFRPFSLKSADKKNGSLIVGQETLLKYNLKKFATKFDSNPDCYRMLCYTNKRVDYWNSQVRKFVYGKKAPRFLDGERLIARSPIMAPDGKTTIFPTSTEFQILDVEEDFYAGYAAWKLQVKTDYDEDCGRSDTRQVYCLHEDGKESFDKDNQRLLKSAKSNPVLWKAWYEHSEIFADVRNCWALTVHNSQGSTFEEVGIDGRDINRKAFGQNGSIRECNQLWYVSASRAKNRVLITS